MELIVNGKGERRVVGAAEHTPKHGVVYQQKDIPTWQEQVAEGIRRSNYRESIDPSARKSLRIPIYAKSYFAVVFTGDWHIGAEGFDWEKWHKDMQIIMDTDNVQMFLMGDLIDNFNWFPGAHEQLFNPAEQTTLLSEFLSEALDRKKILAHVSGNHDAEWMLKHSGLEVADVVYRFMRVPYLREGGLFYLDTGDVTYTVLARHRTRYNSSFNIQHGNRRAFHMEAKADVVVSGHTHELGVSDEWLTKEGEAFHTFMVKSGSYKRFDRYSREKGYPQRQTGAVVLIFNPFTHEIYGITGVQRGVKILQQLNSS